MGVGTRQVRRTVTWRTGWGVWMFAPPAVPLPALASLPLVTFTLQSSSAGPGNGDFLVPWWPLTLRRRTGGVARLGMWRGVWGDEWIRWALLWIDFAQFFLWGFVLIDLQTTFPLRVGSSVTQLSQKLQPVCSCPPVQLPRPWAAGGERGGRALCSAGAGLLCCCILNIPECGRSSPNPNPNLHPLCVSLGTGDDRV